MTDFKINWGSTTDFTLTNLHSLAGGNIWVSNAIADGDPSHDRVIISYSLHCDASVVADEQITFYLAKGDDNTSEIRTAGISSSEQEISTANTISDIVDVAKLLDVVRIDRANQDIDGFIEIYDPGPDWQLLIYLESSAGALDASGSVVSYRLGTTASV